MAKPDEAQQMTDVELALLEQRIAKLYKEAADELQGTIDEYFKKLEERDKHQQELLAAGKITQQQYTLWRMNQIARGSRFEALRDLIAYRYSNANAVALNYANDSTAGIYALNRNYITWEMQQKGYDVQTWTIFDEHTVKRLIKDEPDLMPYYPPKKALNRGIDLDYGRKRITESVTSGILQGLSTGKIADKLQVDMYVGQRAGALRAARTAVTSAQNAGRQDGFKTAADMGIKVKKEWVATKDGRTRHEHGAADGQIVPWDEPFIVDGYPMMYPGDKSAPGHLVYNCRCCMVSATDRHLEAEPRKMRVRDPKTGEYVVVQKQSFREWDEWQIKQNRILENEKISQYDNTVSKYVKLDTHALYMDAKEGKRHSGIYKDAVKHRQKSIEKSIASHSEQVEIHAKKLNDPRSGDKDWDNKTQKEREGLLRKWQKDMNRNAEQAEIEIAVWLERFGNDD